MKNLSEIIEQKNASEQSLFAYAGVTGVEVGYKYVDGKRTDEISIRVQVEKKKKNVAVADRIPAEINGIKTDIIERKVVPFTASVSLDTITALVDSTKYPTLRGGVSIGPERVVNNHIFAGTLGCIVKDNATNQPMLLSNFHVMCIDNNSHVGDKMCQPSRIEGGIPGTDTVGALQRSVLSGHVDGAISTLTGRPFDCSIVDIGDVKGTATTVLNAPVRKRGRTTVLTFGFVDAINSTVNIDYGPGIGTKTLTNQIGIRPDTAHNPKFSDHGDSGSVVMDANNKVVGLLFAGDNTGYTYMNPIAFVLSELNISMCVKTKSLIKDAKDGHKDKIEKLEHKDKIEKIEIKDKNEKIEHKEKAEIKDKNEKIEHKDKIEKIEHKDFKEVEKNPAFEGPKSPKELVENPGHGFDPTIPSIPGGIEQRLTNLEQMLGQLSSFISSDLRPDLSKGALKNEQDWQKYQTETQEESLVAKYQQDNLPM